MSLPITFRVGNWKSWQICKQKLLILLKTLFHMFTLKCRLPNPVLVRSCIVITKEILGYSKSPMILVRGAECWACSRKFKLSDNVEMIMLRGGALPGPLCVDSPIGVKPEEGGNSWGVLLLIKLSSKPWEKLLLKIRRASGPRACQILLWLVV